MCIDFCWMFLSRLQWYALAMLPAATAGVLAVQLNALSTKFTTIQRCITRRSILPTQVVLFCIGAQSAIIAVLRLALWAVAPRAAQHTVLLPWRNGQKIAAPSSALVFSPVTVGLAVVWGLHRDAPWAWLYQV